MEEIKPKKERKFLKAVGKVAGILIQEFVLGLGRKFISKKIDKIGKKRQALLIFLALFCNIAFAAIDSIPYPITGNKQRLGWQTTGNGLVYRGRASDTITKPSNYTNKDIKAYLLVDTVNNVMYSYIASKGGWKFNNSDTVIIQGATMPFDSITFNTAKDGTVGVGEVEYNDTQGSLIQGLKGGNVTNVIGQQLHQRVNNRTGATLNKGDVVYLSGSQGNRITVAKAIATSDPTSANTFGIVAESIADNASGYVITEGLITGLNTSALTQDSAVYLSGTTAGALTSTKPQAPIHGVYIGVCVKSNSGSGELFCKVRNGLELDELHDVQITSPVNNASLYYKSNEGLWRDTTAALLVSDTAAMLTPYFRDADTTSLNLTSRFAAKLNLSDTASMLTNYLRSGVAASTYQTKLNGTGFVKASGTTISYDNSTYLTTSLAASTYLPLTGGTLTGDLYAKYLNTFAKTTYVPFNAGIGEQSIFNVGTALRGGTVMVFPDSNLVGSSANIFLANSSVQGVEYSAMGSGIRNYSKQGGDNRRNSLAFYTSGIGSQNTNRLFIDYDGNIGINDDTPSYKLDVNGTVGVTGATTLSAPLTVNSSAVFNEGSADADFRVESDGNANMLFVDASTDRVGIGTNSPTKTLEVNGEVKISTTTATPTVLLGKDGSNVVGAITLGSGLTLSSGTLTASGATGVTSVTATSPLLSSGGSTPNITITDASTTTSGVITTGTQSIAGAKTFTSATVINGGLVVNEDGSSVGTFRVEGDNNTSLIQTLPASDYVGIGRVPENSFDVQGAVRFRTLTLNGTPTRIIGADATGDINQIALGSGLSLSSGTLSATNNGTVTNVTGTLPISVANGTTTPSITIANASTSASGVVTTGTQSFAGSKTFTNIVGFQRAIQRPVETITVSSASITTSNTWVIVNNAGTCTLTLPSAGSSTGTEFFIKTITNNTVVSASSNIVPLAGGSAGTAILSASAGKWATLVSDGTNWVIMQAN